MTPAQRQLADQMIGYWANFAATGDRNRSGPPPFRVHDPVPHVQRLAAPGPGTLEANAEHRCGFWASLGAVG